MWYNNAKNTSEAVERLRNVGENPKDCLYSFLFILSRIFFIEFSNKLPFSQWGTLKRVPYFCFSIDIFAFLWYTINSSTILMYQMREDNASCGCYFFFLSLFRPPSFLLCITLRNLYSSGECSSTIKAGALP